VPPLTPTAAPPAAVRGGRRLDGGEIEPVTTEDGYEIQPMTPV
jgi:hypothetical protein